MKPYKIWIFYWVFITIQWRLLINWEVVSVSQRKWLEVVDPKKVDLYPIQFANCDRLEANDAVFIFDEVGSGKTISSGLMALDYLEKNPKEKVLVITTNALSKGGQGNKGQFLNDWFSKLPFKEMGFENSVHLINNHFKNIEKNIGNYGLIIIDEAHLFIEKKTKKYEQLIKMNAHKVVFLTATPIKNSEQDLKVYITIADEILEENNGITFETLKNTVSTIGKKPEQLICSFLNKELPVTRYFKDTIQDLNIDNFEKEISKRYHTLIENYDVNYGNYKEWDELRVKALVRFINSRLKEEPDSRFVIFTRYIQKEAQYIADYLYQYEGYKPFGEETEKTYAKVTGENSWELARYSGKTKSDEDLPQILIVSYQLAEQGVNLPGFNHIINYHVPAYPAALEQRYGRIDRLTKDGYKQIFNCFILRSGNYGTNEENFRKAVSISLHNLLKHLPSRNVILSKQTLQNYLDISEHRKDMHDKLQQAVENIVAVKTAFDFYIEQEKQHVHVEDIENVEDETTHSNNNQKQETILEKANEEAELLIALLEGEKRFEINSEQEELTQSEYVRELSLFKAFLSQLIELEVTDSKSEEKRRKLAEDLLNKKESIWDEIFYKKKNEDDSFESLGTINAISGCASFIKKSPEFNIYKQQFMDELKNTYIFNKIKQPLNEYFERMFLENKFIHLFPYIVNETYQQQIKKAMEEDSELKQFVEENRNKDERDVILNEVDGWVETLPVFMYFKEISLNLCKRSTTNDYSVTGSRMKYSDGNHFAKAIKYINDHVFELGDAMREEINKFSEDDSKKLSIKLINNEENTFEASNWLKIIYHGSRKEVYAKVVVKEHVLREGDFPYFKNLEKNKRVMLLLETKYPQLLSYKEQWNEIAGSTVSPDVAMLKEVVVNEQIDEEYKALLNLKIDYDTKLKTIRSYRSLFSHILFSDSGNTRAWVDYPFTRNLEIPKDGLVYVNDYWTKGILYELQAWQMSESNDLYSQYKISKRWTVPIK